MKDYTRKQIIHALREIEQLREKIVSMEANMQELMDESDKYMWERDEARQERDIANSESDKYFAAYHRTLRALNAVLGEP